MNNITNEDILKKKIKELEIELNKIKNENDRLKLFLKKWNRKKSYK